MQVSVSLPSSLCRLTSLEGLLVGMQKGCRDTAVRIPQLEGLRGLSKLFVAADRVSLQGLRTDQPCELGTRRPNDPQV